MLKASRGLQRGNHLTERSRRDFRRLRGEHAPQSDERLKMSVDHTIFKKRLSFTRAPDWVQCELCQRNGEHLPARFVVAVDDESDRPPPIESRTLRLLCIDCSALVEGAIDAAEWKRRTNFSVAE
jgi:hypothetical protein